MLTRVNGMCRVSVLYRQRYRELYTARTALIGHHSGHLRSDWLKLGVPGERLCLVSTRAPLHSDWLKLEPLALDNPRSPLPLTRWRLLPLSRSVESAPVIYMCRVNSVCVHPRMHSVSLCALFSLTHCVFASGCRGEPRPRRCGSGCPLLGGGAPTDPGEDGSD